MRLIDLQEWSVLQAAQRHLLTTVESAVRDTGAEQDLNEVINSRDRLIFIRYELEKLPMHIRPSQKLEDETTTQFKHEAYKLFASWEKVLLTSLPPGQSTEGEEFPKLLELERQQNLQVDDSETTSKTDSSVVVPIDDTQVWTSILESLTKFNKAMERLFWPHTREPTPPTTHRSEEPLFLNPLRKVQVEAVLECLKDELSECKNKALQEHLMLLQLTGQKWKTAVKNLEPISVFLSSCSRPSLWQAVECSYTRDSDISPSSKFRNMSNLCQAILESQCYNETLELLVHDRGLQEPLLRKDRSSRQTLTPMKTIQDLFDDRYLSQLNSESVSATVFTIQEKRALALNIAWCFIYLFDLMWFQGGWSADKIFLTSSSSQSSAPLLLDDPPYIMCAPPATTKLQPYSNCGSFFTDSVFLSLGKLLVEIETGKNVTATERNKLGDPSLWLTIDKIIRDGELSSACNDYIQAIEGCLDLHRLVDNLVEEESSKPTGEKIHSAVIAKLEKDYSHYRRPNLKRNRSEQDDVFSHGSQEGSNNSSISHTECSVVKYRRIVGPSPKVLDHIPQAITRKVSQPSTQSESEIQGNKKITFEKPFHRPTCRDEFEIAIICALPLEYNAVVDTVDEFWDENGDPYGKVPGDPNDYGTGRIGKHNVVLVLLPHIGKAHASSAANSVRLSYRGIKLALVVGICGAVPRYVDEKTQEIRLGDAIMGHHVVQYDFGREYGDRLHRKDTTTDNLGRANKEVRALTKTYRTYRAKTLLQNRTYEIRKHLQDQLVNNTKRRGEYDSPDPASDKLFNSGYRHRHIRSPTCACASWVHESDPVCEAALKATCAELQCDETEIIIRDQRDDKGTPMVHIGAVASGDTVVKSGTSRDRIAKELDVIAFEMEGSGVWDELPCLLVKGVCDYADSHKDKTWQKYAAATAAAASKAFLERYIRTDRPRHVSFDMEALQKHDG